jgi:hypothetical protein
VDIEPLDIEPLDIELMLSRLRRRFSLNTLPRYDGSEAEAESNLFSG